MKQTIVFIIFLLLTGCVFFSSCQKELSCDFCAGPNQPPFANAGRDQVITLPKDSIILDGSASSDRDGKIIDYQWRIVSGLPSVFIIHPGDSITAVKKLLAGIYKFELKVTDNGGLSSRDTVNIIVDSLLVTNHAPVADAGADQIISLSTGTMTLDGSKSADPDNDILSYFWAKISGPTPSTILDPSNAQTGVLSFVQGVYLFELKVTDPGGLGSQDTIQVTVENTTNGSCPFQQSIIGTIYPYRFGFQMATAGNKLAIAGGWEIDVSRGSVPSYKVNIFDLVTKAWSTFDLNNHGGHIATIAVGDKIYFAGGDTKNLQDSSSAVVDIYNTSTDTWSSHQLSEPRWGIIALKAGNKILFAGGWNPSGFSTRVDIYDLSTSSWSTSDDPNRTFFGTASALGNKAVFQTNSGFDIYDASTNSWSTFGASIMSSNMTAATLGNKIYFAGGYNGTYGPNNFSDAVHIYDVVSNVWSATTMSQPKASVSSVGAGNKIFWAAGFDSIWHTPIDDYFRPVNDVEIFDVTTGNHSHHFMQSVSYLTATVSTINRVLFLEHSPGALHIYNLLLNTWTVCNAELGWAPQFISIGNSIYVVGPVGQQNNNLTVWRMDF